MTPPNPDGGINMASLKSDGDTSMTSLRLRCNAGIKSSNPGDGTSIIFSKPRGGASMMSLQSSKLMEAVHLS